MSLGLYFSKADYWSDSTLGIRKWTAICHTSLGVAKHPSICTDGQPTCMNCRLCLHIDPELKLAILTRVRHIRLCKGTKCFANKREFS